MEQTIETWLVCETFIIFITFIGGYDLKTKTKLKIIFRFSGFAAATVIAVAAARLRM